MADEEKRRLRAEALRYKRPALDTMGFDTITAELEEIAVACDDLIWAEGDVSQPVMDGDSDDNCGYRMEFSELSAECERLLEILYDTGADMYDDCTVGLVGNRYRIVGYDGYEEDYFALCRWDENRAQTEAGKRLMRLTKAQMISTIGRSVGVMLAFFDLRQRYDYLSAALNVTLDHNLETLHTVRAIEEAYEEWSRGEYPEWYEQWKKLDRLCSSLDEIYWIT